MTRIARTALAALTLTLGAVAVTVTVTVAGPTTALACGSYGTSAAEMARLEAEDTAIRWVRHGFQVRTEVVDIPRVDVEGDRAVVEIRYRHVERGAGVRRAVLHLERRDGRFVVARQSSGAS